MNKLTEEESMWLGIMRINRASTKIEIDKEWTLGLNQIRFHWKSKKNFMGRFGGGWNIKLGFQCSNWRYIIFNLLICSLSYRRLTAKV